MTLDSPCRMAVGVRKGHVPGGANGFFGRAAENMLDNWLSRVRTANLLSLPRCIRSGRLIAAARPKAEDLIEKEV